MYKDYSSENSLSCQKLLHFRPPKGFNPECLSEPHLLMRIYLESSSPIFIPLSEDRSFQAHFQIVELFQRFFGSSAQLQAKYSCQSLIKCLLSWRSLNILNYSFFSRPRALKKQKRPEQGKDWKIHVIFWELSIRAMCVQAHVNQVQNSRLKIGNFQQDSKQSRTKSNKIMTIRKRRKFNFVIQYFKNSIQQQMRNKRPLKEVKETRRNQITLKPPLHTSSSTNPNLFKPSPGRKNQLDKKIEKKWREGVGCFKSIEIFSEDLKFG